jgi:hypothetical protein
MHLLEAAPSLARRKIEKNELVLAIKGKRTDSDRTVSAIPENVLVRRIRLSNFDFAHRPGPDLKTERIICASCVEQPKGFRPRNRANETINEFNHS